MNQANMKEILDRDLERIIFSEDLKERIRKSSKPRKTFYKSPLRYAAIACLFILVLGTTAAAGYFINNIIKVNGTVLPELDSMQKVEITFPDGIKEENGLYFYDFTDIDAFAESTGLHLLTTELAQNNPYMQGNMETDKASTATIRIKNFIIGDTSHFEYNANEQFYSYMPGMKYKTPITLEAIVILSDEQLEQGLDSEYLGFYEYAESFVSSQGYKVNLIQSANSSADASGIVSGKCAVFVADGIQYALKGSVSTETMKEIINSLQ
ncbi:hypothetical protein ABXS75_03025 [Roseburia hominis]